MSNGIYEKGLKVGDRSIPREDRAEAMKFIRAYVSACAKQRKTDANNLSWGVYLQLVKEAKLLFRTGLGTLHEGTIVINETIGGLFDGITISTEYGFKELDYTHPSWLRVDSLKDAEITKSENNYEYIYLTATLIVTVLEES